MDAATLLSTNALLSTAAVGVMTVVLRTRKTYAGFGFWTAGIACLALGAALLVPDVLPPTWFTRMLRNGLLVAGQLLLLRGMLVFRGLRVSGRLEVALALLFLLPFGLLSLDVARLAERIAYYCGFSGLLGLATVAVTLRRRPPHFGSNDLLLALWLTLFSAISFVRAAQELAHISTAYEVVQSFGSIYALAQILSVQLVTLTLISMNSQRIEWELRASALQVQASEHQLRLMGDNLPAGFIYRYELVSGLRRFVHISGGVAGTFGLQPAEVMADAEPLFAMLAPEARERYVRDEAHSAATLCDYRATLRFQLPDGRTRWLDVSSHPQRRPDGSTFWDGVALDVTERRRVEEDLQRYKALADSSEDAIIGMTLDGDITSWNPAAERFYGHAADEVLGRPLALIIPAERADEEHRFLARIAHGEPVPHFETERLHRDGRRVAVSVAVSPIRDADGQVIGASTIARDITERLAARQQAQRLAAFYRCLSLCNEAVARCATQTALFDAICRAIIEVADMRLAWVSLMDDSGLLTVQAQAGAPAALPQALHGWADLNDSPALGPTGAALRGGQPMWCQDFSADPLTRAWHAQAPEAGFHAAAALPVRRGGVVVGALTICAGATRAFDDETRHLLTDLAANISFALDNFERDAARSLAQQALSAHHQALEDTVQRRTGQLAEARARAEAASQAKSAFLANMSHEIRTPLNAMMGMAHLIRQEALSASQAERLGKLEDAARHLRDILNAVLDLSKIEAGKMVLEAVPVQVDTCIAQVLAMLQERAEARHLSLRSEVDVLPGDLIGDPTRLQQALLNYAHNAIKFTEAGSVTLRALLRQQDDSSVELRFEVEDTGIGIPPEVMPRLFAAFEQAEHGSTRQSGGTGLGLAITRRLAEMMGGEAGARSEPGRGSTFWFTVRLRRAPGAALDVATGQALDAPAAIRRHHRGARVLVAEDNEVNAEVARALLEDVGLAVDLAEDGEAARAMARAHDYRLVLMDMQMPRMDGLDACRAIRAHRPAGTLPIIAMTANAFAEDRVRCQAAGMDDFISKPVDPALLYRLLWRWLERSPADLPPP